MSHYVFSDQSQLATKNYTLQHAIVPATEQSVAQCKSQLQWIFFSVILSLCFQISGQCSNNAGVTYSFWISGAGKHWPCPIKLCLKDNNMAVSWISNEICFESTNLNHMMWCLLASGYISFNILDSQDSREGEFLREEKHSDFCSAVIWVFVVLCKCAVTQKNLIWSFLVLRSIMGSTHFFKKCRKQMNLVIAEMINNLSSWFLRDCISELGKSSIHAVGLNHESFVDIDWFYSEGFLKQTTLTHSIGV